VESGTLSKKEKPLYGMLFSIVGGIIILLASALDLVGTSFIWGGLALIAGFAGVVGLVMGVLIILFAFMKSYMPKYKNLFAILILILAILNMLLGWDILVIGAILVIIGAIMGYMGK
jgi:hypothetical protein